MHLLLSSICAALLFLIAQYAALGGHCRQMALIEYKEVTTFRFDMHYPDGRTPEETASIKHFCEVTCGWRISKKNWGMDLDEPTKAKEVYEANRHPCQADVDASPALYLNLNHVHRFRDLREQRVMVLDIKDDPDHPNRITESRCFCAYGFLFIPRVHNNDINDKDGHAIRCALKQVDQEFENNYTVELDPKIDSAIQILVEPVDPHVREGLQDAVRCAK